MECEVRESIAGLAEPDFAGLRAPAGLYGSRGWLEACERLAPGPVRYVVAASGGDVAGVVPLFLLPSRSAAGLYDPVPLLGRAGEALGGEPLAVAGARAGYLTGWAVAGGGQARLETLNALLKAAAREARECGAGRLSVQYLPRPEAQLVLDTGLVAAEELVLQDYDTSIDLPGDEFEDYVKSLAASRRSTVRRDLNASAAAGHTVETMRLSESLAFAPELLANVQRRHHGSADVAFMRTMLENQATSLDDLSVVFAVRDPAGEPVAYSLAYRFGDTLYARLAGLRHDLAIGTGAYFRCTYYEPIRYAYRRGLRCVHLGIGSLRPKLLRGGRPRELYGIFRGADGRRLSDREAHAASARTAAAFAEQAGGLSPRRAGADAPSAARLPPGARPAR
jgi:hypothetical protein